MSRYKAYSAYKDSGIEWVGEIPTSWQVAPLFSVASSCVEKNGDGAVSNVLSLSYGRIIRRDVEDNHGLLPESFNTYQIVDSGNIILRLTDLQNDKRSLRVGMVNEKGIITSAYLKLTAKAWFLDCYLYRLLHSYDTTKVFYGMGGGLRQSMKFEEMRRLQMLCPSLEEQKKIATFLDHETAKIDALIEKQRRLIELLKEKRQAVISHAVTKGLNPNAPMKDSGVEWLGEVPAHWDVAPLKRFTEIIDCKHYTVQFLDAGLPIVSIRELKDDLIDLTNAKLTSGPEWEFLREGRIPRMGDIVFCRNASVGAAGYVDGDAEFCMGQDVCLIRTDKANRYLHFQITSRHVREQIEAFLVGATIRRANVEEIRRLVVAQPPEIEQIEIAKHLENTLSEFDALSAKANQTVELLQERRTALISAAVTGKIDVRDWQAAAAA